MTDLEKEEEGVKEDEGGGEMSGVRRNFMHMTVNSIKHIFIHFNYKVRQPKWAFL